MTHLSSPRVGGSVRILLIHPNYHSGGAEIAGNWPPAWAAYLTGSLKAAGYEDVRFIDAMTNNLTDDALAALVAQEKPDIVGATAITPSIYKAERALQIAKAAHPNAVALLGGVHATFMYQQVLTEAPWIDAIVRGEGEEILIEVVRAVASGDWAQARRNIRGLAFVDNGPKGLKIVATEAAATVKNVDAINPDWSILEWDKYKYIPLNCRVAIPNMARGCPFTCSFCSQWKFWRDYRIRDPKKVVDEIQTLYERYDVKFFILADEEPTINRKKFVQFCEELIARKLPEKVQWGINTRVTDILRDEKLLPLYRKAGLIHVSLGTEAAAQLKLDRFNKETKVADNKKAIQLLRDAGIVVEAQFIVGLENETAETLEETYRMAMDWKPDLANWSMYTPWPFTQLFKEMSDKVEIFDFEKYNFVTPIIKPEAMDRAELLDQGDEQLPAFLYEKGALLLSVGRHRTATALSPGMSESVLEIRLRKEVLRSRQGRLLGPSIEEERGFPLRSESPHRACSDERLESKCGALAEGAGANRASNGLWRRNGANGRIGRVRRRKLVVVDNASRTKARWP